MISFNICYVRGTENGLTLWNYYSTLIWFLEDLNTDENFRRTFTETDTM